MILKTLREGCAPRGKEIIALRYRSGAKVCVKRTLCSINRKDRDALTCEGEGLAMNLEILYEDCDIILCRKPAGVAAQTKRIGQQDMESLLKNYRAKKGETPYVGVVHRLDQPVEGLMVFAKNQKAAASLSKQIQEHMIGKYYYAVSEHSPAQPEGILENYLVTDKKTNHTTVSKACKGAKKAVLSYQVLEHKKKRTLYNIKLDTGRQHQIRVQFAHMGCPLVGDSKYGNVENGQRREALALCSYRLQFMHPVTGKQIDYSIVPKGKAFAGFFSE